MGSRRWVSTGRRVRTVQIHLHLALSFLAFLPFLTFATPARAGNNVRLVPISWCAMQGTNAATGAIPIPQPYPGTPPDTTTDGILWRRHERATDNIYAPQAQMTFRSSVNNPFDPSKPDLIHFPVIQDVTTGAGHGQLGDVLGDPVTIFSTSNPNPETRKLYDQCRAEWVNKYKRSDGIFAVNINRFVDTNGNRLSNLAGMGGWMTDNGIYSGGAIVVDNTTIFSGTLHTFEFDTADQLVGHEFGHALGLDHRTDDPLALMSPGPHQKNPGGGDFTIDNLKLNSTEVATVRANALKLTGVQTDPPGLILDGDVVGTLAVDETQEHDLVPPHLDLAALHAALDQTEGLAVFGAELFGAFPSDEDASYWILVDTDADPMTGGGPSDVAGLMGPTTGFQGIDLAIRADVFDGGEGPEASGAVWRFVNGAFVAVSSEDFAFRLQRMNWYLDPPAGVASCGVQCFGILFHTVSVSIANSLVGLQLGSPFLIQALAVDAGGTKDALDETPGEEGKAFILGLPDFAHCFPQSDGITGRTVQVELEGLTPDSPIHGLLGPRLVYTGTTDAAGGGTIDLPIPADAEPGLHLVTVGVDDTAFTADCAVNVVPNTPPTIRCPAAGTFECTSPSGTPGSLSAHVEDVDGDALVVTLNVDGSDVSETMVDAGGPPTAADVGLEYAYGLGMHDVMVTVSDGITAPASCSTNVTILDRDPPVVTCSIALPLLAGLFPPSHNLQQIGFTATARDACEGALPLRIAVFGDEDDEENTGDGVFSPDATWRTAPGTLRLRNERKGDSNGRVYLVAPTAADTTGTVGFACCADAVPHDTKQGSMRSAARQAHAAQTFCEDNAGAAPAGYFPVGDGAVIGPKQ
jgi:hypothetical protein